MPIDLGGIFRALVKAAQQQRVAENRPSDAKNLRTIGDGLKEMKFWNRNHRFPPDAIFDKDGKPLLSWRVALLEKIGEGRLFMEFKRDEPWDSPHNLKLLARMPAVYAPVSRTVGKPYTTFYQVFTGPQTVFPGPKGLGGLGRISDGAVNTLFVVEAAESVPWTKPADLAYTPDGPLPRLGAGQGFHALFCDGTVRFVHQDIDEKTLRALITPGGGEAVNVAAGRWQHPLLKPFGTPKTPLDVLEDVVSELGGHATLDRQDPKGPTLHVNLGYPPEILQDDDLAYLLQHLEPQNVRLALALGGGAK